jgi:hypothetical protein
LDLSNGDSCICLYMYIYIVCLRLVYVCIAIPKRVLYAIKIIILLSNQKIYYKTVSSKCLFYQYCHCISVTSSLINVYYTCTSILRLMQNKRLQYFKGRAFKEFVNIVSQSIINAGYIITLRYKCHCFMSVACNI